MILTFALGGCAADDADAAEDAAEFDPEDDEEDEEDERPKSWTSGFFTKFWWGEVPEIKTNNKII